MGSLRASISLPGAAVSLPSVAIRKESLSVVVPQAGENGGFVTSKRGPLIAEIPLEYIRRPLLRTRSNDPEKVKQLMESIAEIGLQVPIDVLEVDGVYYGFSGCHRYEAHQKLGLPTIKCKIRRGTRETLRMSGADWGGIDASTYPPQVAQTSAMVVVMWSLNKVFIRHNS